MEIPSNDDYEKQEKNRKKRITDLAKNVKDNAIIEKMKEQIDRRDRRNKRMEDNDFYVIDEIIDTARSMYWDGDVSVSEAVDLICEALEGLENMEDSSSKEERKEKKSNRETARSMGL